MYKPTPKNISSVQSVLLLFVRTPASQTLMCSFDLIATVLPYVLDFDPFIFQGQEDFPVSRKIDKRRRSFVSFRRRMY